LAVLDGVKRVGKEISIPRRWKIKIIYPIIRNSLDFLKLMNMSEADWKSELEIYKNKSGQSSLSDFTK
jgi:hypothetical protein